MGEAKKKKKSLSLKEKEKTKTQSCFLGWDGDRGRMDVGKAIACTRQTRELEVLISHFVNGSTVA